MWKVTHRDQATGQDSSPGVPGWSRRNPPPDAPPEAWKPPAGPTAHGCQRPGRGGLNGAPGSRKPTALPCLGAHSEPGPQQGKGAPLATSQPSWEPSLCDEVTQERGREGGPAARRPSGPGSHARTSGHHRREGPTHRAAPSCAPVRTQGLGLKAEEAGGCPEGRQVHRKARGGHGGHSTVSRWRTDGKWGRH